MQNWKADKVLSGEIRPVVDTFEIPLIIINSHPFLLGPASYISYAQSQYFCAQYEP